MWNESGTLTAGQARVHRIERHEVLISKRKAGSQLVWPRLGPWSRGLSQRRLLLKFYRSSADGSVRLGFPMQVIPTYKIQSSLKFYLFNFLKAFLSVTVNFIENFLRWENSLKGTEDLSFNNCRLH